MTEIEILRDELKKKDRMLGYVLSSAINQCFLLGQITTDYPELRKQPNLHAVLADVFVLIQANRDLVDTLPNQEMIKKHFTKLKSLNDPRVLKLAEQLKNGEIRLEPA